MCLIILKPPGEHITRKHLKESFVRNKDGGGFAFIKDDSIHIVKGFFGFRSFYKAFRAVEREHKDSAMLIHFRIGTSGHKNATNCHPFLVQNRLAFAHNGVMRGLGSKEFSDTHEFVKEVLDPLPVDFEDNNDIVAAIHQCALASNSKYVMLFPDNTWVIFNEKAGHWRGNCWFSNSSYSLGKYTYDQMGAMQSVDTETFPALEQDSGSEYDAKVCLLCGEVIHSDRQWSLISDLKSGIAVCRECYERAAGTFMVICPYCNMRSPLTEALSYRDAQQCEYCNKEIDIGEILLQLSVDAFMGDVKP